MKRAIKNLLRIKGIYYYEYPESKKYLDEDVLYDYCAARALPYHDIHDELQRLGYELI